MPLPTTPITWVADQDVTAGQLNGNLRDNLLNLDARSITSQNTARGLWVNRPANPANGDSYWATDHKRRWNFDGTRWLSEEIIRVDFRPKTLSSLTVSQRIDEHRVPGRPTFALWLASLEISRRVHGTNDATHGWNVRLYRESTSLVDTVIAGPWGSGSGTNTLPEIHLINAVLDASAEWLYLKADKVNSPATMRVAAQLLCNYIGPA